MTDKITSLLKFWPVAMLVLAAVSSSFAFYYQMQKLHSEFKLRDTQIIDLKSEFKSWVRQQESINRDFEDDVKYLHRNTR